VSNDQESENGKKRRYLPVLGSEHVEELSAQED
jgi:hypothetical protein